MSSPPPPPKWCFVVKRSPGGHSQCLCSCQAFYAVGARPLFVRIHLPSTCIERDQGGGGDALEGKGPQRRPKQRLGRRLEEVAKAVGGGHCRLQMPPSLALGVRETWLGIGWAPSRGVSPPSNASRGGGGGLNFVYRKRPN